MDLIKICEFLSASNLRNYRDDDLWIDRLSHRYSVVIFTLFAVLVTSKAYIGDPIGKKASKARQNRNQRLRFGQGHADGTVTGCFLHFGLF